jgi:hypothetical protein
VSLLTHFPIFAVSCCDSLCIDFITGALLSRRKSISDLKDPASFPPILTLLFAFGIWLILAVMFVCCGARSNSRSLLAIGILFMICFFISIAIVTIVVYTSPALVVAALDLNASSIPALSPDNVKNRVGSLLIITCILQFVSIIQTLWFRKQVTGNETEEEEYWKKVQQDQASAKAEQQSEKAKRDFEMRARAKAAKSRV